MFDQLKDLIVAKSTVPEGEVTEQATLEELGLDSLDVVEFAEIASDRFGVSVTDDEMFELERLDRIADLIRSRQPSNA